MPWICWFSLIKKRLEGEMYYRMKKQGLWSGKTAHRKGKTNKLCYSIENSVEVILQNALNLSSWRKYPLSLVDKYIKVW